MLLLTDTPITYKGKAKYYNEAYKDLCSLYKDDEINVIIQKWSSKTRYSWMQVV